MLKKHLSVKARPFAEGSAAPLLCYNHVKHFCYEENVFRIPFLFSQTLGSSANTYLLQVNRK